MNRMASVCSGCYEINRVVMFLDKMISRSFWLYSSLSSAEKRKNRKWLNSCLACAVFISEGDSPPTIQLPTPAVQRPSPITLFQPSVSSTAQVAVQAPSLPLRPALPPQRFAGPSQADTHLLHSGVSRSVKRPTPVSLESTNRIPTSASPAHSRFATSTIQPPKEYPSVSTCPRNTPISQAPPIPHSHVYQPPPLGHPAALFGTPPRFSFHHPYFLPGPHYFPSR